MTSGKLLQRANVMHRSGRVEWSPVYQVANASLPRRRLHQTTSHSHIKDNDHASTALWGGEKSISVMTGKKSCYTYKSVLSPGNRLTTICPAHRVQVSRRSTPSERTPEPAGAGAGELSTVTTAPAVARCRLRRSRYGRH